MDATDHVLKFASIGRSDRRRPRRLKQMISFLFYSLRMWLSFEPLLNNLKKN